MYGKPPPQLMSSTAHWTSSGGSTYAASDGSPTWVLSSHDVPRHASRLALPPDLDLDEWLLHDGTVDAELGRRRARAATLMMLALPGSPYLYQGEELGLTEVADLPTEALRDPVWRRSGGTRKGRDGCRVPIPWTTTGPSFGFGTGGSWLPQPHWFGTQSVEAQRDVAGSTLSMYRTALQLRRTLPGSSGREITFRDDPAGILTFDRGAGFRCMMNFSDTPHRLPTATILLASEPCATDKLPPNTTAWLSRSTDD